jgi:transcriptional regulator with XRE-family HTH domain
MKTLKALKRELLANPGVQTAFESQGAEFSIVRELIAARMRAGLTQSQIAQRMGTTQSVIARLEGGQRTPSISTVQRYALAAGCKAVFRLEPLPS